MPKAWRKINVPETCPECDSFLITVHNDSNIYAYCVCEDCEAEMELDFAEPYVRELHKHHYPEKGRRLLDEFLGGERGSRDESTID